MIDFLTTTVIFLLALGILVVVHEWGHYIVAKMCGIWVEKFSIGFGPKIVGFKKGDTDYRIAPIPLGGYVKLYGQDPYEEADRDEEKAKIIAKDPRSFASKTYWQRMCVVLGGPVVNLVLCLILLPLAFMAGKKEFKFEQEAPKIIGITENSAAAKSELKMGDVILKFNGSDVRNWTDLLFLTANEPGRKVSVTYKRGDETKTTNLVMDSKEVQGVNYGYLGIEPQQFLLDNPIVGDFHANSPAAKAGLQKGDRITVLGDVVIDKWSEMVGVIQEQAKANNGALKVGFLRDGQQQTTTVNAEYDGAEERWLMGIAQHVPDDLYVIRRYGFTESVKLGIQENNDLYKKLFSFLKGLFTGQVSVKRLGGPIQIASQASSAAKSGLGDFIYLLGFLSLQLGILNLLPVPVLDGGHALIMSVEALFRNAMPHKVRLVTMYSGAIFILGLLAFVVLNDIDKMVGFTDAIESLFSGGGSGS